jgi:hypothetical protein
MEQAPPIGGHGMGVAIAVALQANACQREARRAIVGMGGHRCEGSWNQHL